MREIVTFFLSGKQYGVDVSDMQGLENYQDTFAVKDMPDFLQGLITVRGEKIPVLDIKKRLVLPPVPTTVETKYVMLRTSHGTLAFIADGVSQIFRAEDEDVQGFPSIVQTKATDYVSCVINVDHVLVLVMKPERLLDAGEWKQVDDMLEKLRIEEEKKRKEQEERERREREEKERREREEKERAEKEEDDREDD